MKKDGISFRKGVLFERRKKHSSVAYERLKKHCALLCVSWSKFDYLVLTVNNSDRSWNAKLLWLRTYSL